MGSEDGGESRIFREGPSSQQSDSQSLSRLVRVDIEETRKKRSHGRNIAIKTNGDEERKVRMEETIEKVIRESVPEVISKVSMIRQKLPIAKSKGNRKYHPPGKYHATSTMVEHKNRWTYRMACEINAAEQSGDGQMYYVADPFLPMPGNRKGIPAAVRMNYAAQRLDNRKFRAQVSTVKRIAEQESASCDKCGMRYFLPAANMQQRITFLLPEREEDLPTAIFKCPVCNSESKAEVFS